MPCGGWGYIRVGSGPNYCESRYFDMCLVERNVSGCGHGVISVNPGIMICALWIRKVSRCVHCLISVNPGIFLQIQ